jgi:uncharacterized membrane protein YhaH (DUF805 family)
MRVLSLLFDPRGAVDRRAFWSGLLQLTAISVAVAIGLTRLCPDGAPAALPVIGEAFTVGSVASHVYGANAVDIPLTASILLVVARLYVTACLMLKRARHAGKDPAALLVVGLASLLVHGLMGLWAHDLLDDDMAVMVPLMADAMLTAGLGLVVTAWLGALRPGPASAPVSVSGLMAGRG